MNPQISTHTPDPALVAFMDEYVQKALQEQLATEIERFVRQNDQRARELSLLERIIRVEEETKALREVEMVHFSGLEKRIDALHREMNARFEASDKRIDALHSEMNARFEASDKRIDALHSEMNVRFKAIDSRFEAVDKRFNQLLWTMLIGFTMVGTLVSVFGFLTR